MKYRPPGRHLRYYHHPPPFPVAAAVTAFPLQSAGYRAALSARSESSRHERFSILRSVRLQRLRLALPRLAAHRRWRVCRLSVLRMASPRRAGAFSPAGETAAA
jgi:hypothetical protein